MSITYRLRPEVDTDRFLGGVLAVPNDQDIDVKHALGDGDGVIVIADHEHGKAAVLDAYPPLERVDATDVPVAEARERTSVPADPAGEQRETAPPVSGDQPNVTGRTRPRVTDTVEKEA